MSEASATLARRLAVLPPARHHRRGQRALLRDRVLRVLVADLVAARTAAGMTQHEVAMRMWTTKSAVSRLERGRYARPTLDTVEKYALAVGARVEIRVRPGLLGTLRPSADDGTDEAVSRNQPLGRSWPIAVEREPSVPVGTRADGLRPR